MRSYPPVALKLASGFALAASLAVPVSIFSSPQSNPPGGSRGVAPTPEAAASEPRAATRAAGNRTYRPQPPPAAFSPPVVEVDEADHDWGSCIQGEVVRHSFRLTNKGGAPLEVLEVKSCTCTSVAKPERPIEPGQSGVVTLELDTKKLRGPTRRTTDIFTNANSTPLRVSMGGKVELLLTVEPPDPRIDIVRGVSADPVKLTLRRSANAAFKVKEVKAERFLTATLSEPQPGGPYEVALQANVGDDPGKLHSEQVRIKVDANGKELDIPVLVSVSVRDRIDVQPRSSVYFGRNETRQLGRDGASTVAKTLDIKSLGGQEHRFQIMEVKQEDPSFETEVETVAEGKHYRLVVRLAKLPMDPTIRTVRDTITVLTDDPAVRELKVTALAAVP
ncbi:MAG: DUF1573 domain-containing protein [Planctomycetes bacterium]|nr:DUF1573 domain-containing protein [Planctomycetota bacterium]